jgi:hypothetical protein
METAPECAPRLPDCFPTPSSRLPPLLFNPLCTLGLLIDYLLFGSGWCLGGVMSGIVGTRGVGRSGKWGGVSRVACVLSVTVRRAGSGRVVKLVVQLWGSVEAGLVGACGLASGSMRPLVGIFTAGDGIGWIRVDGTRVQMLRYCTRIWSRLCNSTEALHRPL